MAIANARECGIHFGVLTGRKSSIVERRMTELGVEYIFQGVKDKKAFLINFFATNDIEPQRVAYIGDDLNDLSAMQLCAFKACPVDACMEIRNIADYVSEYQGDEELLEIL